MGFLVGGEMLGRARYCVKILLSGCTDVCRERWWLWCVYFDTAVGQRFEKKGSCTMPPLFNKRRHKLQCVLFMYYNKAKLVSIFLLFFSTFFPR